MEISKACVVKSKAGRDKGGLFYVLDVKGDFAFIADGRRRKVEAPKRKRLKHLCHHGCPDTPVRRTILSSGLPTNAALRRALTGYRREQEGNSFVEG